MRAATQPQQEEGKEGGLNPNPTRPLPQACSTRCRSSPSPSWRTPPSRSCTPRWSAQSPLPSPPSHLGRAVAYAARTLNATGQCRVTPRAYLAAGAWVPWFPDLRCLCMGSPYEEMTVWKPRTALSTPLRTQATAVRIAWTAVVRALERAACQLRQEETGPLATRMARPQPPSSRFPDRRFPRFPRPGMRSIHPHEWHLCGWIERTPGGNPGVRRSGDRDCGGCGLRRE